MGKLRQPIISVLGHVDHGKTSLLDLIRNSKIISKEAGGITQHIGATEVPRDDIVRVVDGLIPEEAVKLPGLLFIDTPGHKAFTSLRKRGGSISDIGILVVDITEGFKPQTAEAVEILKSMNTPFVIAANKIDKVSGWRSGDENSSIINNIESQRDEVKYRVEEMVYNIVGQLNEYGLDADRFDRVDDFTKKLAIVPISSVTGEGSRELLSSLVGLTQKYMQKKLTVEDESKGEGVILEVKDYTGLGKTIDVILHDGVIEKGDKILALDVDSVQESRLKCILKPNEMKEIRDQSTKFDTLDSVCAASGVKLACPDFVDIKAGMPIVSLRKDASDEEVERAREKLLQETAEITQYGGEEGVLVKADTLGSLEALSNILEEYGILLRRAAIGKVTKKDIIDAAADLNKNPKNALILNFSQKLDDEIKSLGDSYGVEIISNDIIYKLVDDARDWIDAKEKEIERKKLESLRMPFKVQILKNCIFRSSSPAVVGVEVMGGVARTKIPLMTDYGRKVGTIKSIKDKDENLQKLELGKQAAISVDDLVIGRHAQENSVLYTFMGEENFRQLKKNKDLLSKDELQILKEIAEIMRKEDTLWGL